MQFPFYFLVAQRVRTIDPSIYLVVVKGLRGVVSSGELAEIPLKEVIRRFSIYYFIRTTVEYSMVWSNGIEANAKKSNLLFTSNPENFITVTFDIIFIEFGAYDRSQYFFVFKT